MSKTIKDITLTQTTINATDYFELQEDAGTSKKVQASVLAAYATLPVGSSIDYSGPSQNIPSGWMIEDGSSLLRASYTALFSALTYNLGTVTMTSANPGIVTCASHGFITGDRISFTTTGALPSALTASTNYYVVYINSSTFNLATTWANAIAGTKIDTSSGTQSGTHTCLYNPWGIASATTFNLPDTQGLSTEGSGTQSYASWASANYLGRLGQYKQDNMQGHKHDIYATNWGQSGTGSGPNSYFSGSNNTLGAVDIIRGPVDDFTHGTPRTGYITAGPRVGKYKIIKVI